MKKVDASIIILVKNEENTIGECLSGIFRQKTRFRFEVIVIDSGSTDNTLKITKRYPVRIIQIKPEEFGHGKTRNLGAKISSGRFLVYLTADAIPYNEHWLENLLKNFGRKYPNLAGVYSRWIPRERCQISEERYIYENFPDKSKILNSDYSGKYIPFSDVSSCIKKEVWNEINFDDNSIFGEDYKWAARAVKKGFTIVYEPESIVVHSHTYSLKAKFRRGVLIGIGSKGYIKRENLLFIPLRAFYHTFKDIKFVKSNKIKSDIADIVSSYVLYLSGFFGKWIGSNFPTMYFRVFKKGAKWQK